MKNDFIEAVEANPIIAAVKDEEGLNYACQAQDLAIIFVLFGDIRNISGIVRKIQQAGKIAMVHIDLIAGLSAKEVSVDYLKEDVKADGIISTRTAMIQRAKKLGMYTVLRFFLIDSMALKSVENLGHQRDKDMLPDVIEVLPGVMPKIIRKIVKTSKIPVIAGGLISDKEDVMSALDAGAAAVSSTNRQVWEL